MLLISLRRTNRRKCKENKWNKYKNLNIFHLSQSTKVHDNLRGTDLLPKIHLSISLGKLEALQEIKCLSWTLRRTASPRHPILVC